MPDYPTAPEELHRQVRQLFAPPSRRDTALPPTVGLEIELLVHDLADDAVIEPARVRTALAADQGIECLAAVSFEPGGQLELSLPPKPSVAILLEQAEQVLGRVADSLAKQGLTAVAAGLDRRPAAASCRSFNPAERYRAMREHFDRIGPAGRTMMCLTASLQVCVGWASQPYASRQWLAANLVGPVLAAVCRTPTSGGNRTAVWLAVDDTRTGFDAAQVDAAHPVEAYERFALDASIMPLQQHGTLLGLAPGSSMRQWMAQENCRPDAADLAHHLSTLFPPVRPRGYLEVRYLDAQPLDRTRAATTLVAVLLGDPATTDAVIDVMGDEPSGDAWRRSALLGLDDPVLAARAGQLAAIAASGADRLRRRWPGWLPGDADDLIASIRGQITPPELARGQR